MEEVVRSVKRIFNQLIMGALGAFFAAVIVIQIYDNGVDETFTLSRPEWKCTSEIAHPHNLIDEHKCTQWTKITK